MGAWSHEPFGNDAAGDWSDAFVETTDLSLVEATLDEMLASADEYLEGDTACETVAAIEVLAKLLRKGTQADPYTKTVDRWVSDNPHAQIVISFRKPGMPSHESCLKIRS
jgi:hypothetical protein